MNQERKQFEAWVLRDVPQDIKESALSALAASVREDGDYKQPLMQAFWEGWQARAALSASTEAAGGEPVALSDDWIELYALKHIAPHANRMKKALGLDVPYQQTEQFRRMKAYTQDVLAAFVNLPGSAANTEGGNVEFKNFAQWKAHYLPNDFVMGDNTKNIGAVVTRESVEKALRLDEATLVKKSNAENSDE